MPSRSKAISIDRNGTYTLTAIKINGEDYISLTDMVKNYGGSSLIEKWLSNKGYAGAQQCA